MSRTIIARLSFVLCASLVFLLAYALTAHAATCPCSLFGSTLPATPATNDPGAVELGLKFTADRPGYITGVRFYKGTGNNGTHIGNLWSSAGANLATVTFTNESASGWQQANFANPVAITASTTYIISYFAPTGFYANNGAFFASAGFNNSPLHAPSTTSSGGNGVYRYGATSGFPTNTYNATNYWVDAIFSDTGPTSTPVISSFTANPVAITQGQSSTLSWSVSGASSLSIDHGVGTVSGTSVNVSPSVSTTYTLTATNGSGSVSASTTITVSPPPPPTPNPILVITSAGNPFTKYYTEILSAEGYNEYSTVDISNVTPSLLSNFDEVILGDMPLTASQVTMLTNWVNVGGGLVVMHPDKQLAGLLGLATSTSTLSDAYLLVDTTQAPGLGIVATTTQFHGAADLYTLNGARAVATLYSNATTTTTRPAVTIRSVGAGEVAAFTFDLARSIVYTRQGNPAWAGQERDNDPTGIVRADDMFYPNYLDLNKVAIPQADEAQRLLANLLLKMNSDLHKRPMPHFWYFPSMDKAIIVAAGDDHATTNGTQTVFDQFVAASPAGCSVADWNCYRATSWIYTSTPLTPAAANTYEAEGFDIGNHVSTGCANYPSYAALSADFDSDLQGFIAKYPSLPLQRGNRTHCIPMTDWFSEPKAELAHGIRIDMNYYYWPDYWVQNRPGFMNGSGIPMRYADIDGTTIDVYQQATHIVNENGESYPAGIEARITKALGSEGYYGAFGTHYDYRGDGFPEAILSSAQAHQIPIVSADQMLTWVDGRNASTFTNLAWANSQLSFTLTQASGARNLYALLPTSSGSSTLQTITRGGAPVVFSTSVIKGVQYAIFPAQSGTYTATYGIPQPDTTAPSAPTGLTATPASASQINLSWIASTDNVAVTGYKVFRGALQIATTTTVSYSDTGLAASTTYSYTVRAFDAAGNVSASSNTASATTQQTSQTYSLWSATSTPVNPSDADTGSVELGVKFTVDVPGTIKAIRFYKAANNTGAHVAHLWSATGTLLGTVTSSETASGWQQFNFATPIAISANTTYVASYLAPNGHYAGDNDYFNVGVNSGVLHAPTSAASGGNGVYTYTASASGAFPSSTYFASNYWVDVVFSR